MYYLVWVALSITICVLVFILLMVALGNKVAIEMTKWTLWFFLWFGLFFWWFLCVGFRVLNWTVGVCYEYLCGAILFVLGGKRKKQQNGSKSKPVKIEVNCNKHYTSIPDNHDLAPSKYDKKSQINTSTSNSAQAYLSSVSGKRNRPGHNSVRVDSDSSTTRQEQYTKDAAVPSVTKSSMARTSARATGNVVAASALSSSGGTQQRIATTSDTSTPAPIGQK